MKLSVNEIVEACHGFWQIHNTEGGEVSCVELDSRKIATGGVFIATPGERVDGHRFIPQVEEKGVKLVIGQKTAEELEIEYGFRPTCNYVLVEDSMKALQNIATFYREKLSLPIVGITGSVGKTSTKEFVAGVLGQRYKVLKTQGNYNNEIGVPLTLLQIREQHTAAVIEMGINHFGEMSHLSRMAKPDICVITNIGECHLENLLSRDGVLRAKTEIFESMNPDGEVVLNGDDDKLITLSQVHGKKPHFFSLISGDQEVYAAQTENLGLFGSKIQIHRQIQGREESFEALVPLPGIHMVKNAACATCVAGILGLSKEEIVKGLAGLSANRGRGEIKRLEHLVVIDECYNANPASMEAALDLLAMAETKKVAILGDMFELGENSESLHERVGRKAATSGADILMFSGENSASMYEGAKKAALPGQVILYYPKREQLIEAIKQESLIPEGSTVLLKASHGMHYEEILAYFEASGCICSP